MNKFLFMLILPILLLAQDVEIQHIAVHNRPLVKLNGKTISLVDVMKKMNAFLYQNYPQAIGDEHMLYQFYMGNWRATLDDIINQELMLMAAEAKEMKVSDGDVREEVEARFGPNIMASLAQINLSLEEARTLIHSELIVQRMMGMNVHQKAWQEVTPTKLKEAYAVYCQSHPPTDKWNYQVLSIRGDNQDLCKKIANQAENLLNTHPIEEAVEMLTAQCAEEPDAPHISLSEEYELENAQLSEQHRSVLETLTVNNYSSPIAQQSRALSSEVWRIFRLNAHENIIPQSFGELTEQIKRQLLQERFNHHSTIYHNKLRDEYNLTKEQLDTLIPNDYVPFVLK